MPDAVNHPPHYNTHPVCEAIDLCEELSFNLGNAVKYLWRAGKKDDARQDVEKALWYLERECYRVNDSGHFVIALDDESYGRCRGLARVIARHDATPALLRCLLDSIEDKLPLAVVVDRVRSLATLGI